MAEDVFPSLKIDASGERRVSIDLPPADQTQLPTIPEGLRDKEIPSYVLEWLMEADEMGLIIQELLQAPTKSLCRMYQVPTGPGADAKATEVSTSKQPEVAFGTPRVQREFLAPQRLWEFGASAQVSGFSATAAPPETIEDLPEGIHLPVRLAEVLEMAKRLEAWIQKGRRVRAWAEENGHGDASWLPGAQG